MKTKGQTSVEITIIIGVLLIVFLIFFATSSDIYSSFVSKNSDNRIRMVIDDLSASAELVYAQGAGAKTEVYVSIPQFVADANISDNTLSYFMYPDVGNDYVEIYSILDFNITGSLPSSAGNYQITLESFGGYVNVIYT